MSAMLQVIRPFRLADAARPYQVVVDGEPASEVGNNASTEIPVAAGTHTLQIRVLTLVGKRPSRGSQEVSFEVGDGQAAQFSCHPPGLAQAWYLWVGDPARFIRLERAR
jgi:hypothetical protein